MTFCHPDVLDSRSDQCRLLQPGRIVGSVISFTKRSGLTASENNRIGGCEPETDRRTPCKLEGINLYSVL